MHIQPLGAQAYCATTGTAPSEVPQELEERNDSPELRDAFHQFVGQTFFGQMLGAMRKTVGKPAYLYGGRAEEIFRSQLDQVLSEKLTDATADSFSGPMYDLFTLPRR